MNYINNWQRPIALSAEQTSVALDLPDGTYRLTVADSPTAPAAWEIVDASVTAGTATLTRAQEGTQAATWGTGSVIYCSITADTLSALQAAAPSFKPLHMLAEGDTLQLTAQRVHIYALLLAGTGALTLRLPAVDTGSLMGASLEWDITLNIDPGSSLIIEMPPGTLLGTVDLISSNPSLLEVAGYDAQTGQLTITGPASGPGGLGGSIEVTWADQPGAGEVLLIALKNPDVPPSTLLYPSP